MAIINFVDVGTQGVIRQPQTKVTSVIPVGFKTPLEIDESGGGIFKMHFSVADQIQDNLRNLVLTNHGERLALYDFGANLRPLLTEFSNKDDFDSEAMRRISSAVSKYLPFVTLLGYESIPDLKDNTFTGHIRFRLSYSIPLLNITNKILEIELFVI